MNTEPPIEPDTSLPGMKELLQAIRAMGELSEAARFLDARLWNLIKALTDDPQEFPSAVKVGTIGTDVATIRISGTTGRQGGKALEIPTGADGAYDVFCDRYDEYGSPGRIIIQPATMKQK